MNYATSQTGISLIKSFEGCRLIAYKCPAGVWTIGYGHTSGVTPTMKITPTQADVFLKADLKKFETAVNKYVEVDITQNMFDALVSFTYNCGAGALQKSTLLKKLNSGDYKGAADQFLVWTKANGTELAGLVRRSNAERDLFLKDYNAVPSKSISKNSSKVDVCWLQTKLNECITQKGFVKLVVDGSYGPKTKDAVLNYWKQLNWNKDGKSTGDEAGAKTIKALAESRKK